MQKGKDLYLRCEGLFLLWFFRFVAKAKSFWDHITCVVRWWSTTLQFSLLAAEILLWLQGENWFFWRAFCKVARFLMTRIPNSSCMELEMHTTVLPLVSCECSVTARKKRWGVLVWIGFVFAEETSLLEQEIELESCVMPVRQSIATPTFPQTTEVHLHCISSSRPCCLSQWYQGINDPRSVINSRTNHLSASTSHVTCFSQSHQIVLLRFPRPSLTCHPHHWVKYHLKWHDSHWFPTSFHKKNTTFFLPTKKNQPNKPNNTTTSK